MIEQSKGSGARLVIGLGIAALSGIGMLALGASRGARADGTQNIPPAAVVVRTTWCAIATSASRPAFLQQLADLVDRGGVVHGYSERPEQLSAVVCGKLAGS